MHKIHKELLINDVLIKEKRREEVLEVKRKLVEAGRRKNQEIQTMYQDMSNRLSFERQPVAQHTYK